MKIKIIVFTSFWLTCTLTKSGAQSVNDTRPGSNRLAEGVFLSPESAALNIPELKKEKLFLSFYDSSFTVYRWAQSSSLYYTDETGARKKLLRDSIWFISDPGSIFIFRNGYFHKVSLFGSLVVFNESYPVIRDPMSVVVTEKKARAAWKIYDFETNRFFDFDENAAIKILSRDSILGSGFLQLKGAKAKKRNMYSYMERYNDLHPLNAGVK